MDMIEDVQFFADHSDRNFRIRQPIALEFVSEFLTLGPHQANRRRILVSRVDERRARHFGTRFARIPFLLFADETVEDRDDILEPLFKEILSGAAFASGDKVVF